MNTCKIIQLSIIVIIGLGLLIQGPSDFKEPKQVWAYQPKGSGILYGQPRRYPHSGRVYFRVGYGPRRGYYYYGRPYYYYRSYPYQRYYNRSEVFLTVREDPSSKESIRDVYIDNYRVNLDSPSPRGYRGSFTYRLGPGNHMIEWTVEKSKRKQSQYQRQFYVDGSGRSVNLTIDGDQFYRN